MLLMATVLPPKTCSSVKLGSPPPRGAGKGSGWILCSLLSWSIALKAAPSDGCGILNVVGSAVGWCWLGLGLRLRLRLGFGFGFRLRLEFTCWHGSRLLSL